jgi:predicted cobalt transporter CbtA
MSAEPTGPRGPKSPDPAQPKRPQTNAQHSNASRATSPRREAQPANPIVDEAMAQIEERTLRNPIAAVAIAAGAGFLLSKMRADKMAWRLGLFPAIAGAAAGFFAKR